MLRKLFCDSCRRFVFPGSASPYTWTIGTRCCWDCGWMYHVARLRQEAREELRLRDFDEVLRDLAFQRRVLAALGEEPRARMH